MGSSIVRGLVAGAVLLSLAAVAGTIGVFDVSDLAAGGTIVTLLLLLGLVLFDDSWEPADAPGHTVPGPDPMAPDGGPVANRVVEADPTAA
ncbi:MAG: hypothetical protein ACRDYF_05770 [Acidimicrobiia bacterium]